MRLLGNAAHHNSNCMRPFCTMDMLVEGPCQGGHACCLSTDAILLAGTI